MQRHRLAGRQGQLPAAPDVTRSFRSRRRPSRAPSRAEQGLRRHDVCQDRDPFARRRRRCRRRLALRRHRCLRRRARRRRQAVTADRLRALRCSRRQLCPRLDDDRLHRHDHGLAISGRRVHGGGQGLRRNTTATIAGRSPPAPCSGTTPGRGRQRDVRGPECRRRQDRDATGFVPAGADDGQLRDLLGPGHDSGLHRPPGRSTAPSPAAGKVYDGGTAAEVLTRSLAGVLDGDEVELTGGAAAFGDAGAGADKTVTLTGAALAGAHAGNYLLSSEPITAAAAPSPGSGSRAPSPQRKSCTTGRPRPRVLTRSLVGALDGDEVELTGGTAAFADANAGPDKTVTLSDATLTGAGRGNYSLTGVADATAAITKKLLTVTGPSSGRDRLRRRAPRAGARLRGLRREGETAGRWRSAGVRTDPGYHGAGSYPSVARVGRTATTRLRTRDGALTVATKALNGSFTAADKDYDGDLCSRRGAAAAGRSRGRRRSRAPGERAAFADKNAGPDKVVTADIELGGADARQLSPDLGHGMALASITQKLLTVTGPSPAAILYGDALPDTRARRRGLRRRERTPAARAWHRPASSTRAITAPGATRSAARRRGRQLRVRVRDGGAHGRRRSRSPAASPRPTRSTTAAPRRDATPSSAGGSRSAPTPCLLQVANAAFEDRNAGSGKVVTGRPVPHGRGR